jgi:hypothetical protein
MQEVSTMLTRIWLRAAAPLTTLILAGALIGTAGAAQATPVSAGHGTEPPVRVVSTEEVRAMAAQDDAQPITLGKSSVGATGPAVITCSIAASDPYGGGPYNSHIYVDGILYCDDYVDLAVMTLELYRQDLSRVANRTSTLAFVYSWFSTAEYGACVDAWYFGVAGASLSRYGYTSATITDYSYLTHISCAPAPPPNPAPLVLANPGSRQSLDTATNVALQMSATGGTTAYTWSATGLPTGLSINASTGLISGNTLRAGGYVVNVTVTDSGGRTATVQFTWAVKRDGCARC